MLQSTLDCIIVGYNDVDLQTVIANRESMRRISGVYSYIMTNVVRFRGKWLHYMDFLNAILKHATNKEYYFHLMEMPNLGVCYLKSFLTRRNFNVEIVNFFNEGKERLADLLQKGPQAVAITTTFYAENSPIAEITQFIKQHNSETKIIVGGPHIFNICNWQKDITTQDYLLENIGADIYINDSQGEDTLSRVLHELRKGKKQNLGSIPNLIYEESLDKHTAHKSTMGEYKASKVAKATSFVRTQRKIENNNMDENAIDWSFFPKAFYTPTVQMRTARSCAFACAFCNFPVVAGPLSLTSLDVIEREMKQLHNSGVKNLVFIDDTFNVPLPRFKKILRMMIANKFNFNWFSFFRCSNSDDEAFDLVKESGCKGVFLGIESGDQGILDNMNKHAKIDQYKNGIHRLDERDIITYASFVVGFPGETKETIQNTINFIEEAQPTYYKAQLYYHSDHVPINKEADRYGLQGGSYSWRHNTMDWKEACDMVNMMYKTIKGSVVFPFYMFDFWAIPYLFGKGISLEHIKEFVKLSQPILTKNFDSRSIANSEEENIYQTLFSLGKKIARDIESSAI